jgi:hypothetical protein
MRIDTAGNVGIGTTSVSEKLSVNGSIGHTDLRVLGDNANLSFYLTSPSDWRFRTTSGTERMRITSSGLIGVGAGANTGALIDIQGNAGYNTHIRLRSYQGGAVVEHWNGRGITNNSDTGRLGVGKNGNALIYTSASGNSINAFAIGNSDAKPLVFSTGNAEN